METAAHSEMEASTSDGALDGGPAPGSAGSEGGAVATTGHGGTDAGPVPPELIARIAAVKGHGHAHPHPTAPMRICFDRVVPAGADPVGAKKKQLARAAYHAALSSYAGSAESLPDLSADHPIVRARMALINQNKWPDGHVLTCKFLDGEPAWQQKVMSNAKRWEQFANVKLSFVTEGDADVRISFFADPGSWSAVGTDCLNQSYFPPDRPTMNYGWLRDDTSDQEYERVVVHEFGHALGCIHEHQQPNETLSWNKAVVYRVFSGPPNNWSRDEIDHNILQKYGAANISATLFDQASIMLYQFDPALFTDHVGTPLNYELSANDKSMITRMYPFPDPGTPVADGSNPADPVVDPSVTGAMDGGAAPV